jgi:hypothetical protein
VSREGKKSKRKRGPKPVDLDKIYVQQIMLAGKIVDGVRSGRAVEVGGDAGCQGTGMGC